MKPLAELLSDSEDWLMHRLADYTKRRGYAKYTSTLAEAWRVSLRGLTEPMLAALEKWDGPPELGPDEDYTEDPIAAFGITEARLHRSRGVTLDMFLGLMKYYRQSYVDLIAEADFSPEQGELYRLFVDRFFDRVELGFCVEWAALGRQETVTELQDANRRMTNEKNRYLTVFESLREPAAFVDPTGRIENLNKAWAEVFLGSSAPGGTYYGEGKQGGRVDWLQGELDSMATGGLAELSGEKQLKTSGGVRHFRVSLQRMLDISEKFSGTVVLLHDLTERFRAEQALREAHDDLERRVTERTADLAEAKARLEEELAERERAEEERQRLEAQLRQQQKLESIGTLASGVAHEINNPISIILNCADLISEDSDPSGPTAESARHITEASQRVATIVRALLAFARQEQEAHSPARIADIVNGTVSLIRKVLAKDQIRMEVDVPEDLPTVKCRSNQIQQIIMNLLTNARDALNSRYTGYHEDKVVIVRARIEEREGETWVVTMVEDHGTGVPAGLAERIFDPFFTTKPREEGTGLGLSVSHGIAKDHLGQLRVESEEGQFTRFYLDLRSDNRWSLGN